MSARRHRGARVAALAVVCLGCRGDGLEPQAFAGCGPYPDHATSDYVLPWRIGESYVVGQGNCSEPGRSHATGSPDQYAFDFLMPIGTTIVAARQGTVVTVVEAFAENNGTPGQENRIEIRHPDGTFGIYLHLTHGGALVTQGEVVATGQPIGLSGNTGNSSAPHLHFHLADPGVGGPTDVVVFRNTVPQPDGLVEGTEYTAEPAAPSHPRIPNGPMSTESDSRADRQGHTAG